MNTWRELPHTCLAERRASLDAMIAELMVTA